jgi:hypothetical protein
MVPLLAKLLIGIKIIIVFNDFSAVYTTNNSHVKEDQVKSALK